MQNPPRLDRLAEPIRAADSSLFCKSNLHLQIIRVSRAFPFEIGSITSPEVHGDQYRTVEGKKTSWLYTDAPEERQSGLIGIP
jgi:hypothetical protein